MNSLIVILIFLLIGGFCIGMVGLVFWRKIKGNKLAVSGTIVKNLNKESDNRIVQEKKE